MKGSLQVSPGNMSHFSSPEHCVMKLAMHVPCMKLLVFEEFCSMQKPSCYSNQKEKLKFFATIPRAQKFGV